MATEAADPSPHAALLARIPPDIRALLTTEQVTKLATAVAHPPRPHRLSWRISTRLFGKRFYFAVLSGREGRSHRRLRDEGQPMALVSFLLRVVLFAGWITLATLVLAVIGVIVAYLVKSYVGIDLMDGPSFLHHYFF